MFGLNNACVLKTVGSRVNMLLIYCFTVVALIVCGVCGGVESLFCGVVISVFSSFAIILLRKRKLVDLL